MPPVSTSRGDRLAYLDWLRFLVVLSLTPFHAAISFTGMGSVYVYDTPVRDILLSGSTPVGVGPLVTKTQARTVALAANAERPIMIMTPSC